MERLFISTALLLLLTSPLLAEPPLSSYGVPSTNNLFNSFSRSNLNRNQITGGGYQSANALQGSDGGNIDGPKVYRHISLFVAPQEPEDQPRVRTIRPQVSSDKHVQIIFVKAPSHSSAQTTEVHLPPQPEQKTLVYVLVKKPEEATNNVRIRGPKPTKPPAPEVYFIKYKGGNAGGYSEQNANNGVASFGTSSGAAVPLRSTGIPSTGYGAP